MPPEMKTVSISYIGFSSIPTIRNWDHLREVVHIAYENGEVTLVSQYDMRDALDIVDPAAWDRKVDEAITMLTALPRNTFIDMRS